MKQAELAHYRAMLQAQTSEPQRRALFGARARPAAPAAVLDLTGGVASPIALGGPPPRRAGSLFGRRPLETPPVEPDEAEALVLDRPAEASPRLRLRAPGQAHHLAETPYHAEDLADPTPAAGPTPGVIAGWSNAKPLGAQTRLLRRLGAVLEAERHGLAARLAAAGVEAAA